MNNKTDEQLLREYSEKGSDLAFTELVRRQVGLVYSAALRVVRDAHLAQDVAQKAFVVLARNAGRLGNCRCLSSWLHGTTHNIACNLVRAEVRRRTREHQAAAMHELTGNDSECDWETIAPHFDSALCTLSEPDRHALFLRYFEGKSAADMACVLGVSDQAAQKRVNRALERLRQGLHQQGVTVGVSGLALLIAGNAVQAVPAGLASVFAFNALHLGAIHSSNFIKLVKLLTMTITQKTIIVTLALAITAAGISQLRRISRQPSAALAFSSEVASRDQAGAPKILAGPPAQNVLDRQRLPLKTGLGGSTEKATAAQPFPSTQIYAVLKSKAPQLGRAQVESFLASKGRSASNLLAGFRTTSDRRYLAEAIKSFPQDPQVAFEAATASGTSNSDRRRWLDAFKQAAPDNSLADYLSADAHFKAGQPAQALQALAAASSKMNFNDYTSERVATDEAAYLASSYPVGEAKLIASAFVATPHLLQLKDLGQELVGLSGTYAQAGDSQSRDSTLQAAMNLGRRLDEPTSGESLSSQLIGISIERSALSAMDPAAQYDSGGSTVQQRLDLLAERKESIHVLTKQADPLWPALSDQAWVDYHAQLASSGEEAALHWLISNFGSH